MGNIYSNPSVNQDIASSDDAGKLTVNIFEFDMSNSTYAPESLAAGDQIQVGLVPAGDILVPHLCAYEQPALDTNGTPTGQGSLGTAASAAAVAAASSFAAKNIVGSGFALGTGEVGDANSDTPIYLTVTEAPATLAQTGVIRFVQVTRAVRLSIDGQETG